MTRQEYWLSKKFTQEQINNHLSFERYKNKLSRERRKKNNEKNKQVIEKIKNDLLGKTFEVGRVKATILSINPTTDGQGFWFKANKVFSDGSNGDFREYYDFQSYSKKEFLKYLAL